MEHSSSEELIGLETQNRTQENKRNIKTMKIQKLLKDLDKIRKDAKNKPSHYKLKLIKELSIENNSEFNF